ncbi:hypothetical protein GJW-30_1_00494 [Variibacter gotjawalensis]|uniref:Uncharacterized protein n=1 Tax=Variibacter gotjawalensis TaxID=1333996 RepID=A0A0S3PQC7_9BRAD|nr:hypothetical protein [Variibacter gotjawalensis]NIK48280.1 hypothetical protein [Variibacter gotjawalensis]RZS50152.1 hypothetical protein EV661_2604 [Variibacter gotjawalensis]BAT57982.1 hypothetical protein GJW-30_1_00494 [Variibacter gotjawalensis]
MTEFYFGRRASTPVGSPAAASISSATATDKAGPNWRLIFGALIAAAVVVGLSATAYSALSNAEPPWDSGAYPTVETSLRHVGAPNPVLKEAHETCVSRSIGGRRYFPGWRRAAEGEVLLSQHAEYLTCLTSERPERFCATKDRQHLRYALENYFSLMKKVRAAWEQAPKTYTMRITVNQSMQPLPKRKTRPSDETDSSVLLGVQRLIERGYLAQSDLGGFMRSAPGDLGILLRGVSPHQKGCA